ncbi:MAG: flagellar basal-body rod protein FlgF [Rhizobiaceae bacterium]
MDTGLNVALSSQIALEKRLSTIANNVANTNTVGFRAEKVRFEEVKTGLVDAATSFASKGTHYLSPVDGIAEQTGGELDFAIQGDAWFAVETPAGIVVTRDGRFRMTAAGDLVTIDGHPVLDPGGAPIQLDPAAGSPVASKDGFLRQNGNQIGALGLFEYQPTANFRRQGNSGIIAETTPEPAVNRTDIGVIQGYVERSNVNPIDEMTRLIGLHRTFDNVAALIRDSESSLEEAIRTLGPSS